MMLDLAARPATIPAGPADAVGPCLSPGMLILGFPAESGHRTALFAVTIGAEKVP